MHRLFALLFLLLAPLASLAQTPTAGTPAATLSGVVTDVKTGQPLPFATVYVANTTQGTTADAEGRFSLPNVSLGNLDLVGSAIGHRPARQRLRLTDARAYVANLALEADQKQLDAVTVRAKRSRSYARQLRTFTRELLGARPQARLCKLLNPEVVQFQEEGGHLLATATQPLEVENQALGYKIFYNLLHFDYFQNRVDVAGTARFEQLPAQTDRQRAHWQRARQETYRGSLRHLMATLLRGTLDEEGYTIYMAPLLDNRKLVGLPMMAYGERQYVGPRESQAMFRPGELAFERRFSSPKPLEVYYDRIQMFNGPRISNDGSVASGAGVGANVAPGAYSVLLLPDSAVVMNTDGHITAGRGLDVRGYLGGDRLATLLPDDWQPPTAETLQPTDVVAGKALPTDALLDTVQAQSRRMRPAPLLFADVAKSLYLTGDSLWLSVYALDPATRLLHTADEALHMALVAPTGKMVQHQWLRLQNGRGAGQFRLSDTLTAGTYRLRVWTDAGLATGYPGYERSVTLLNALLPSPSVAAAPTGGLDVQFLPEGGRWLAGRSGVPGRLGIKVVAPDGRGRSVSGVIQDGAGAEVARFQTSRLGMGSVTFTPQPGQSYKAVVAGQTVALPPTDAEGWALTADATTDSSRIWLEGRATGRFQGQPCYVLAYSGATLRYAGRWQPQGGRVRFALPTALLPEGVLRVVLTDAEGQPRAERLVWVPLSETPVQVDVSMAKARFAPHEPMALGLRLRDGAGNPVAARWSATVQDADQLPTDTTNATFRTHTLLAGQVAGPIEAADWYVSEGHLADMDALLLTQGWRKLMTPPADSLRSAGGWWLAGRVTDEQEKPVANRTVLLALTGADGERWMRSAPTDKAGRFQLADLPFTDTVQVQARLLPPDLASVQRGLAARETVRIRFETPSGQAKPLPGSTLTVEDYATWQAQAKARQADDAASYRDKEARQLREVTVKAKRSKFLEERPKDVQRASLHAGADYTMIPDENLANTFGDVFEMIRGRFPAVSIGFHAVFIRQAPKPTGMDPNSGGGIASGGQEALLILDGMVVDGGTLASVPATDVSRIEVLVNVATTAIYGVRAANGVVAVFTKKGKDLSAEAPGQKAINATVLGFAAPREFYVPRYVATDTRPHVDRRDVLFWQPLGQSGPDGLGRLNFPLSDTAQRLRLVLQGITAEGQPISATWTLPVR